MTAYIPPKTLQQLSTPHQVGGRHKAMMDIAISMIGNKMGPNEVFSLLRQNFNAPDIKDREIHDIVRFAVSADPKPSIPNLPRNGYSRTFSTEKKVAQPPEEVVKEYLNGHEPNFSPEAIDPIRIFELYDSDDLINVVCAHDVIDEKARPKGKGKIDTKQGWVDWYKTNGPPQSKAGAWVRMNPCKPEGSGNDGAVTDKDVLSYKFVLVESDKLPPEVQLGLFQKFKLPIAAVISSGGLSYHAWVRVKATTREEYRAISERLLQILTPFGFDPANKNESRLSRLPGAVRVIGGKNGGKQSLVEINPTVIPLKESDLDEFEESLKPIPLKFISLRDTLIESFGRYETLIQNKGRTGIQTGIESFDRKTGGLKNGHLIIVGAQTNVGKTVFAVNVINRAMQDGHKIALFTMEMDRGEIVDLLIAMNARVDRNIFNTGDFSEDDFHKISTASSFLAKHHLMIFEDPDPRIDDIRVTCRRLKAEGKLDMVVADYIQLARGGFGKETREQQVAEIGRGFRAVAKECGVPVLALSQLNEEGKLRESRSISHEANIIMLLTEGDKPNQRTLEITKGRSIARGKFQLNFEAVHAILSERPKIDQDDLPANNGPTEEPFYNSSNPDP